VTFLLAINLHRERKSHAKNQKVITNKKKEKMKTQDNNKVKVHPAAINLLTDATWQFARNILWGGQSFDEVETKLSKIYIREYYNSIDAEHFHLAAPRYFSEFCERILMAKRYVDRFSHRYIPHPCIWFNKNNPKGFVGTKSWYQSLQKKRSFQRLLNELRFCNDIIRRYESA
jgi:hypothetical protein